jgi:release factor glutamine methyltransferase
MSEAWTVLKVLEWTTQRFEKAGFAVARLEAQVLLAHTLGCDRVALYTNFNKPLEDDELAGYRALIQRRLAGEPVAYLVGEQEFWSMPFRVDAQVLIPRRDTEAVIEAVLDHYIDARAAELAVLDVATGSGAIGVTLAKELPNSRVVMTDISREAIALARHNADHNQVGDRVDTRVGDLFACVAAEERFDVVVSNPPYVRSGELAGLSAEVRREPRLALDGGADGLDIMRRLIAAAPAHVLPGGLLVIEHGFDQAADISRLIDATAAFEPATTRKDLAGQPRVTMAVRDRNLDAAHQPL